MTFLLFTMILSFYACIKETVDPCTVPGCGAVDTIEHKLHIVWRFQIEEGVNNFFADDILIRNDTAFLKMIIPQNSIRTFDLKTGNPLWAWDQLKVFTYSAFHLHNEHLFVQYADIVARLNIKNPYDYTLANKVASFKASNSNGQILGDFYYKSVLSQNDSVGLLVRSRTSDLANWDTIYTLRRGPETGGSRPNIQSYNLWIHPQSGDSILVFQHRMAFPNRVDVVAWNLSKSELLWKRDNVTRDGNSNHQQIFIHDNKAYFGGSVTFFCFDLFNGNIIWQHDAPQGRTAFMGRDVVFAEFINSIIVVGDGIMYAFNASNGQIRWQVPSLGSAESGNPAYHNGIIYRTVRGLLCAYRATNGQQVWSESSAKTQFQTSSFRGEIAIDREKGILYVTDQDELFAIKVYKD